MKKNIMMKTKKASIFGGWSGWSGGKAGSKQRRFPPTKDAFFVYSESYKIGVACKPM